MPDISMAEREHSRVGGIGTNVLGKFKLAGGKLVDVGGAIGKTVGDVGKRAGSKFVDVAGDVAGTVKSGASQLLVSDFEKLRHLNQLAKQHAVRAKYTEEELVAVEQRADAIITAFPDGYFDKSFDPVANELAQLADRENQEEIDAIVDRLTLGVEVRHYGTQIACMC